MKILISLTAVLASASLFAGCAATTEDEVAAAAEKNDGMVCRYEAGTGSRLKERVCTTTAQREDAAAEAAKQRQRQRSSAAPAQKSGSPAP